MSSPLLLSATSPYQDWGIYLVIQLVNPIIKSAGDASRTKGRTLRHNPAGLNLLCRPTG